MKLQNLGLGFSFRIVTGRKLWKFERRRIEKRTIGATVQFGSFTRRQGIFWSRHVRTPLIFLQLTKRTCELCSLDFRGD
ncbi:hypothetical protein Pyn_34039 [Prunus yedoensis var. nudiflora]|uniref:Uncharacterized protein n=1 Tax=Prunus yedoensis var. nudiflora TaxID=2094558 RepID=A0A314XIE9_PRUYE|nr:hypothetical protein Pyn_34039 [Prunus yedoensis var. nudiflora]